MLANVLAEVVHARETGGTSERLEPAAPAENAATALPETTENVASIEAAAGHWQPTEEKDEHRVEAEPRGRGRVGRYAWAILATFIVSYAAGVFPCHQPRIRDGISAQPSASLQAVSLESTVQAAEPGDHWSGRRLRSACAT